MFVFTPTLISCLIALVTSDISPNPNYYDVTDANGVYQGQVFLKGTVQYAWEEDEEGFTVVPSANRSYYYAIQNAASGDLVATSIPLRKKENGFLMGQSPLSLNIKRHEQPTDKVKKRKCGDFCNKNDKGNGRELRNLVSTIGNLKNLMILFKFSDHTSRTLPSASDITALMNHPGDGVNIAYDTLAPTGSIREHYRKSSYGKLLIDSFVTNWVTIDYTEAYCSGGNRGLTSIIHNCLKNALSKVDPLVNFTQFDLDGNKWIDAIGFLHSGYGAEWGGNDAYNTNYMNRIWSHKWGFSTWTSVEGVSVSSYHISPAVWSTTGSAIGRIGVIAHETGHFLGLPDLYDTDGGGSGIGSWSLMANSWGFDGTQYYPPPMDAWCKVMLGWVTPTVITPRQTSYMMGPQCQSSTIYKITTNFPTGEYLLIENRQKVCFYDSKMGGTFTGGLAIFHIDENQPSYSTEGFPSQVGWPGNYNHYRVSLLQADYLYELEKGTNRGNFGDLYRSGNTLVPSTSLSGPYPNSDSYAYGIGVTRTGITISSITASGSNISFVFAINTMKPSVKPSISFKPTKAPTSKPTQRKPTNTPTSKPTQRKPTKAPSKLTFRKPTNVPTSSQITNTPTSKPTPIGSRPTSNPTKNPSAGPISSPTVLPTTIASLEPSAKPSGSPTFTAPTTKPTQRKSTTKPTKMPSIRRPSRKPSARAPPQRPSRKPTRRPTQTRVLTRKPSRKPTRKPTRFISKRPTKRVSKSPTKKPSRKPTRKPSKKPTKKPTSRPTSRKSTVKPTSKPTSSPVATASNETTLTVSFLTDNYPSETYIKIYDMTSSVQVGNFASGSFLSKNARYRVGLDLDKSRCYWIYIEDTYGDGMCCLDGPGWYEIYWNGNLFKRSSFEGGASELTKVNC